MYTSLTSVSYSNMSSYKPIVLNASEWVTSSVKYMPPKVNDKGGKSINIISDQTKRSLHISTPLMITWGISDFVDDKGESDGKYSISLAFPNEEYKTKQTDEFLQKLKDFENQILDDAVKNSELWFGDEMSREVIKHMFFPVLKYSKNKDTKKIDLSKPPTIRAKVTKYNSKWGVEIYDTKSNLIFPVSDNELLVPGDLVPKLSQVACVLQCSGLWIGGKGFGVSWKLVQCVVKPREVVSVYGKCHIQLSNEDLEKMDSQKIVDEVVAETIVFQEETSVPVSTVVADSDDEDEVKDTPPVAQVPVVKKVVKPPVAPTPTVSVEVPEAQAPVPVETEAPKKKKIIKKVSS